jgi:hypothetical protein
MEAPQATSGVESVCFAAPGPQQGAVSVSVTPPNHRLQPTPSSLRSAAASGRG